MPSHTEARVAEQNDTAARLDTVADLALGDVFGVGPFLETPRTAAAAPAVATTAKVLVASAART
ncbi:MAG: hypothetical protein WA376_12660, partial [Terrimicrobiaceae bacterium]